MKRSKEFSVFLFLAVLVPICAVLFFCPSAGAVGCIATLSPNMTVHIPAIQVETGIYSADLQYVPSSDGNTWFEVTGVQSAEGVQCENPALFADFAGTYSLVLPSVAFGASSYQAVLEYVPGNSVAAESKSAAAPNTMRLKLTTVEDAGNSSGFASKIPQTLYFDSSLKADVIDGGFTVSIGVQSKVTLGAWVTPLDPGTGTSFRFGAANSTLSILNASCEYTDLPADTTCSCVMKTVGSGGSGGSGGDPYASGFFKINSLDIEHGETPSPAITMNYSLGMFASSVTVHGQCCSDGHCSDHETDYSNFFFTYYKLLHQSEYIGDAFVAAGPWAAVATPWYAMKNYPERQVTIPHIRASGHTQIRLTTR